MEQVLPRPRAGLLARMLRLAPLPAAAAPGCDRPVHLLPAGAEVHMTLLVHQARAARISLRTGVLLCSTDHGCRAQACLHQNYGQL